MSRSASDSSELSSTFSSSLSSNSGANSLKKVSSGYVFLFKDDVAQQVLQGRGKNKETTRSDY